MIWPLTFSIRVHVCGILYGKTASLHLHSMYLLLSVSKRVWFEHHKIMYLQIRKSKISYSSCYSTQFFLFRFALEIWIDFFCCLGAAWACYMFCVHVLLTVVHSKPTRQYTRTIKQLNLIWLKSFLCLKLKYYVQLIFNLFILFHFLFSLLFSFGCLSFILFLVWAHWVFEYI